MSRTILILAADATRTPALFSFVHNFGYITRKPVGCTSSANYRTCCTTKLAAQNSLHRTRCTQNCTARLAALLSLKRSHFFRLARVASVSPGHFFSHVNFVMCCVLLRNWLTGYHIRRPGVARFKRRARGNYSGNYCYCYCYYSSSLRLKW